LEIGIPSGYVVHNSTLQAYVKEQKTLNSSLRNAEFYNGKAVFYFNHVRDTSFDVQIFCKSIFVETENHL